MKLLLDENLSPRLVDLLSETYPGSEHVQSAGLGEAGDVQVWSFAKAHGFTIVSKDSDFADMSVLEGAPPKVIWTAWKLHNSFHCAVVAEQQNDRFEIF